MPENRRPGRKQELSGNRMIFMKYYQENRNTKVFRESRKFVYFCRNTQKAKVFTNYFCASVSCFLSAVMTESFSTRASGCQTFALEITYGNFTQTSLRHLSDTPGSADAAGSVSRIYRSRYIPTPCRVILSDYCNR